MIRAWLAANSGVAPLVERVARIEQELADARIMLASAEQRAAAAEARCAVAETQCAAAAELGATTAAAWDRLDRQGRILVRAVRVGTRRLQHLLNSDRDHAARAKRIDEELSRLNAAIRVVGSRVDAEAEQARTGTIGLFRRIEAIRRGSGPDVVDYTMNGVAGPNSEGGA